MLQPYVYCNSRNDLLNEFVISFFKNIENEKGNWKDEFINDEFRDWVKNRTPKLIYKRLQTIYKEFEKLSSMKRSKFVQGLIDSNDIEKICSGKKKPIKAANIPSEIREEVVLLFEKLYDDILSRGTYTAKYGTRLDHFNNFMSKNPKITYCPFCGITHLRNRFSGKAEQYDHYLPKSHYPLSAVNFKNLVPTCLYCNGITVKANKDVLIVGSGKLFFPFDRKLKGIKIKFKIKTVSNPQKSDWDIKLISKNNKKKEVESWDAIYDVRKNYNSIVKGDIIKWMELYRGYRRIRSSKGDLLSEINDQFFDFLECDKEADLNFIRKPVFEELKTKTSLMQ